MYITAFGTKVHFYVSLYKALHKGWGSLFKYNAENSKSCEALKLSYKININNLAINIYSKSVKIISTSLTYKTLTNVA